MEFSNDYKVKINTWEKKLPELVKDNNYKWIARNHRKIYEYINRNYTNNNTLKGHISVLAGILKKLDTLPLIQKKYSKIASELCLELQDESKKQQLLPQRQQNFVVFDDIIKRREQFKQLFLNDKTNNKYNLSWMLLSLYTMQPPLRQDYRDMQIVDILPRNKKTKFLITQEWQVLCRYSK